MNKKRLCTILGFIAALNINTTNCVNFDKEASVENKTIIELVVGQNPSKRHVVFFIAVDDCTILLQNIKRLLY